MLLGIAGQRGVGKDAFADALCCVMHSRKHVVSRHAFADGVKNLVCRLFGVTRAFIEQWKTIASAPPGFDVPMREVLQRVGEQMRAIQPDVWINALSTCMTGNVIITDVRHTNEFDAIDRWGGTTILVVRHAPNNDSHISENTLKASSEWCYKHIDLTVPGVVNLKSVEMTHDTPALLRRVDYVVVNTGSVESLQELAKELLRSMSNE